MRTIAVLLGSAAIPSTPRRASSALQRGDVHGLRSLVAALGVVGDLRAVRERLEAVGVDAGVVDEEVLATVIRRDEAEGLVVVEPLNGSGCHVISSTALCLRTRRLPRRRLRALTPFHRARLPDLYTPSVPHRA